MSKFVKIQTKRNQVSIEEAGPVERDVLELSKHYYWALNKTFKIKDFTKKLFESMRKIYSSKGVEVYMCKNCFSVYLVEYEGDEIYYIADATSSIWDRCFCGVLDYI